MSRSFKKTPYAGDQKGKWKKRRANDKVRSYFKQNPETQIARGDYRKIQNPWDICDWCDKFETFEKCWEWEINFYNQFKDHYPHLKEPNKKEVYREWYKIYKMK